MRGSRESDSLPDPPRCSPAAEAHGCWGDSLEPGVEPSWPGARDRWGDSRGPGVEPSWPGARGRWGDSRGPGVETRWPGATGHHRWSDVTAAAGADVAEVAAPAVPVAAVAGGIAVLQIAVLHRLLYLSAEGVEVVMGLEWGVL